MLAPLDSLCCFPIFFTIFAPFFSQAASCKQPHQKRSSPNRPSPEVLSLISSPRSIRKPFVATRHRSFCKQALLNAGNTPSFVRVALFLWFCDGFQLVLFLMVVSMFFSLESMSAF